MKYNIINYPEYDFFTYSLFYSYLYYKLKDGDTFVEIGSWLGQSAIYMAERIKQRKFNINFYTIDIFDNDEIKETSFEIKTEVAKEKKIYETYLENIKHVKDYIKTIIGNSKKVYKQFEDESIDFIFFDGDHTHEGFLQDMKLWYPKVKFGGTISGHDYIWGGKGVKSVIDNFSGFKVKPFDFGIGDTWFYIK